MVKKVLRAPTTYERAGAWKRDGLCKVTNLMLIMDGPVGFTKKNGWPFFLNRLMFRFILRAQKSATAQQQISDVSTSSKSLFEISRCHQIMYNMSNCR